MDLTEFAVGQTFSHYRLLRKLGEGGMGIVYSAEDTNLRRQVAIKFLNTDRTKRLSRSRFLREARSASILNHPNIATVYDYGETEEGDPFIVMELLRGDDLSHLLETRLLDLDRSVEIIESVLEALIEAHRHGIVHRDIKPSNIGINELGRVKVLDFGLAKSIGSGDFGQTDVDPTKVTTQTLAGVVVGTPLYVSPEQAMGLMVDERSDLFAVGAVLYECIAGKPAFAAPTVVEIFAQVISATPPSPPSSHNRAIPLELDRITIKALARQPEERYQSAQEFLRDLRSVRTQLSEIATADQIESGRLKTVYKEIAARANAVRNSLHMRNFILAKTTDASRTKRQRFALVGLPVVLLLGLALLLLGLRAYWSTQRINSIAVVPFMNEKHDESLEYLSDGFTDSLISSLSQSDMKVISRNSVMRYRGKEIDPSVVGAELNVEAVLTGRINRSGDDLNITVELIDARDRSRLWGEQYTRATSDLQMMHADIAQKVMGALRQGESDRRTVTKPLATNPAAYDLYLKGRWYWNKLTIEGAQQAVSYFQKAIDLDPNFALAYVGIADTYVLNSWVPANESYIRAKAAASKALQLDDNIGEAHATIGFIKTHYERDWTGGEQEFKRAINLKPNYATAHHWYADNLLARGMFEQYFQEIKRAQELDPLSPIINADIGIYYFYKRDYDRAIDEFKRVEVLFPDFYVTHFFLGYTYTQKRMYPEAIAEYQKALNLSQRHSLVLAALGYTYAVSGKEGEARNVLNELEEMSKERNISPYRYAFIYTGLGDRDEAFKWLDRAYEQHDIMLIYVNVTPFFDSLRNDQRFAKLVERLGLSPQ